VALPTIYRWTGALGSSNTDWQGASGTLTNWVNTFDNSTSLTPGAGDDEARFDTGTAASVSGGGRADVLEILNGTPVTVTSGNIGVGNLTQNTSPFGLLIDSGGRLTIAAGAAMSNDTITDVIGLSGTGSLEVDPGGGFGTDNLIIGDSAGGSGDVTVNGALAFDVIQGLTIGQQGTGRLDIESGSSMFASTVIVGLNEGAAGDLNLDDTIWGGGALTIGAAGGGHVAIGHGSTVLLSSMIIGANGELDVTGSAGVAGIMSVNLPTIAFGLLDVTGGGVFVVGDTAGAAGAITVNGGLPLVGVGTVNGNVVLENGGQVQATGVIPGALKINGEISGTGAIAPLMTLEVNGVIDTGVNIAFSAPVAAQVGDLVLDVPGGDQGTITGFGLGNTIDIAGSVYSSALFTQGTSGAAGTLALSGGTSAPLSLPVFGDYTANDFLATPGATDTIVTLVPCFAAGTRIAIERGDVRVEDLRVGDRARCLFDGWAPIVWIGYRGVDCRRHPEPEKVWPVRVRASAISEGTPFRDLYLSPDHALFLDGVLIPVRCLIDHHGIEQVKLDQIFYYHVELARHDVVLAEGLPAESYLDTGDRRNFANGGPAVSLRPDFACYAREASSCARLIVTGRPLTLARDKLRTRARSGAIALPLAEAGEHAPHRSRSGLYSGALRG
jgi:collagen type I alpha